MFFIGYKVHLNDLASPGYQTLYLIITKFKTYQRAGVGEHDGQRDNFQNRYIFVARRAGFRASYSLVFALVFALMCERARDFRVCRCVHNRARVGVFRP